MKNYRKIKIKILLIIIDKLTVNIIENEVNLKKSFKN